ncbi:LysR family transcriptional regulator [Clostridium sp. SHJSY1]|uniref:LysR family transcriptional regulator n=1 Tax=Clostridium sp. SHJSY1 TaxID=2942483 RepID=UPI002874B233|nr:LysR family transcriptional regulator [Clostridium sp. SHJSY1]MDS0528536.1 LysR family transcriptional regulator [Clostridium sp. SHJSY1]
MTLQQLETFVQIVNLGSFTKAGQNLSLTQSAISHIIASFEEELGFNLLYRNRTGVSLTNEGLKIYEYALDILNKASLIKQEAASILGMDSGLLRVGSFPSVSSEILPNIILNYQKKYPNIDLKIFEGTYDEIEDWISSGTIDLGFSANPSKGLDFIPLWNDNLVVITNKEHPLSFKNSFSMKDLESYPFIMSKSGCDLLIKKIFKENNINPKIKFEIENNHTILSMVSKGLGVSIVPEMILSFNSFKLNVIKLTPNYFRNIGLLIRSYNTTSPAALSFIKELEDFNYFTRNSESIFL